MTGTGSLRPAERGSEATLVGRRLGRYEVLTTVAKGGMATVYVARAVAVAGFERLVAVKVLHPHLAHEDEFIEMFLDEARLAARIRHPNVVATLDISDSEGDGYFIVMDYVEGDHLGALLKVCAEQRERIPVGVTCRIVLDALAGLGAAHDLKDEDGNPLKLVHRDVSPHNVLVGTDGISRLTDFGIAKADVRLASTREGQFKGKLAYMAPEQAKYGGSNQTSDLFSVGIVLWETLTGSRLFKGENDGETLYRVMEAAVPSPSSVFPDLAKFDAVLAKALARPVDDRFQTADEFAAALEEAGRAAGGIATSRQVAETVGRLAEKKIGKESKRIKSATETLGRASVTDTKRPHPRSSAPEAGPPSDQTAVTATATLSQMQRRKSSKGLLALVLALAALLVGVVIALVSVLTGKADSEPAAATAPVEAPEATPEPSAAEAEEPEPEEPEVEESEEDPSEAAEAEDAAAPEPAPERTEERPAPERRAERVEKKREKRKEERKSDKSDPDDLIVNPYRR